MVDSKAPTGHPKGKKKMEIGYMVLLAYSQVLLDVGKTLFFLFRI